MVIKGEGPTQQTNSVLVLFLLNVVCVAMVTEKLNAFNVLFLSCSFRTYRRTS